MKNLLYIGNKLQEANKTVTTIETLSKNLRLENYNVITASSKSNKLIRLFDMLWHILKHRNSIDIVLIDTYSTLNFYYAYLCSKLCYLLKLKYIPILHGGNLKNRLENSKKLSNVVFNNAYKNVSPSKYLYEIFKSYGYSNLVCIPNSIELDNYQYKERSFKKVRLLWVRSFSIIYNPNLAIDLLKRMLEKGIESTLCMVGPENDGTMEEAKKYAKELNVEVKFTGKLAKLDWIELSRDYNVFINTTNIDNTPISLIEAMALGLPVISTNVGGIPFLIEDGKEGVLVEPNNVDQFVNAVKKLRNNEMKTNQMTLNARKKVESFDWEMVKEKWITILK